MPPVSSAIARDTSTAKRSDGTISKQKRKRNAVEDAEEIEPTARRASKRFQYLKPRTKRISQNVITSKWAPLPITAQNQVCELFKTAKRPVILSRRDERQRKEAETVLENMARRLEKQLPRMPFPPKSKDTHFDLDKLVERNRILESQVTPAVHSIELLKAEIHREEASLERDREGLRRLKKNARAEQREAAKQAKKIHALLEDTGADEADDTAELINLRTLPRRDSALEDDLNMELQPLLEQFKSHLDSIRANTDQLRGVDHAISRVEMALGLAFQERLNISRDGL